MIAGADAGPDPADEAISPLIESPSAPTPSDGNAVDELQEPISAAKTTLAQALPAPAQQGDGSTEFAAATDPDPTTDLAQAAPAKTIIEPESVTQEVAPHHEGTAPVWRLLEIVSGALMLVFLVTLLIAWRKSHSYSRS